MKVVLPRTPWDTYVDMMFDDIKKGNASLEDMAMDLAGGDELSAESIYEALEERYNQLKQLLKSSETKNHFAKVPKTLTYFLDVPDFGDQNKEFIYDLRKVLGLCKAYDYELYATDEDSAIYKLKVPFWYAKDLVGLIESLLTRKWKLDKFDWELSKA